MNDISLALLDQLRLADVQQVVFYKRDEITTDLICCDIIVGNKVWFFHEEAADWDAVVDHLSGLPGWRSDWFNNVSRPAFVECRLVAFQENAPDLVHET